MLSKLHSKKHVIILLIILGLFLSLAACAAEAEPDEVTLYLKWLHQAQFAGYYMADEAGYFAENNLQVTINQTNMELAPVDAVLSGAAQFGIVGAEDLLAARAEGKPVVAVAVSFQLSPVGFVTMAESGIQRPHDFAGQRVGVLPAGGTELPCRVVLANVGISRDEVTEVPIEFDPSPFYSGEIDVYPVFVINEPYLIREEGYDINVILASDYGVRTYADTLFTTESLIAENPDLVRRFVSASIQGWQNAIENQDTAVDVVLNYAPDANRGHQEEMMRVVSLLVDPGIGTELGHMDQDVWESVHETMLEYDLLDKKLDLGEAYTNEYISTP